MRKIILSRDSVIDICRLQISRGDCVIISSEDGYYGLGVCYVDDVSEYEVILLSNHGITPVQIRHPKFNENYFQTFLKRPTDSGNVTYRIDLSISLNIPRISRWNLLNFISSPSSDRHRDLIIRHCVPEFTTDNMDIDSSHLNEEVQTVLRNILTGKNHSCY